MFAKLATIVALLVVSLAWLVQCESTITTFQALVAICIACANSTYLAAGEDGPLDNTGVPGPYLSHIEHTVMAMPKAAADCRLSATVLSLAALLLFR